MKKYRTGGYNKELIQEVEVVKETANYVTVIEKNGRNHREAKKSDYHHNYFDDWISARDFILDKASKDVAAYSVRLTRAKEEVKQIIALKNNQIDTKER